MLQRIALFSLLSCLCASQASAADPKHWREKPYRELAALPLALQKAHSPLTLDPPTLRDSDESVPADLQVEVLVDGQHIPVKVTATGELVLPWRQDWIDHGALFRYRSGSDHLSYGVSFSMDASKLPPRSGETDRRKSYAAMLAWATEMNKALAQLPELLPAGSDASQAAVTGFLFVFDQPGATGELVPPDGSAPQPLPPVDAHTLFVPVNPAWHDAWLQFSQPVSATKPAIGAPSQ